jgi:N-acetyl-gamma-glutamyl-phosphate reductase
MIGQAEVVFLCLPDEAARESARMTPPDTLVIDASTAHRTTPGWVYGLPELSQKHREAIACAKRVANPGCHSSGFIALVYPLVAAGLIDRDAPLSCTSLTGYSGGGLAMMHEYETNRARGDRLQAPRPYALSLNHKHLPEMAAVTGLNRPPLFMPVLGDMAQGMLVSVPLFAPAEAVWQVLDAHYRDSHFVRVMPLLNPTEPLDPTALNGTNDMELFVFGHEGQSLLVARLDNLGKGASGAAVQCMNIALGLDESTGLA